MVGEFGEAFRPGAVAGSAGRLARAAGGGMPSIIGSIG
jgi:hypothetical protein